MRTCASIHACVRSWIYEGMRLNVYLCVDDCRRARVRVYIYIYTYTYNTYIYIYTCVQVCPLLWYTNTSGRVHV